MIDPNYKRGFTFGEHAAFQDRKAGRSRRPGRRSRLDSPGGQGFWDGYRSRSDAWAAEPVKPAKQGEIA